MSLLGAALVFLGAEPAAAGDGPSAKPASVEVSGYGGPPTKWRFDFVPGDATAYTRLYIGTVDPANLYGTQLPGLTNFNTDLTDTGVANLTHYKNGQESAALQVLYGAT